LEITRLRSFISGDAKIGTRHFYIGFSPALHLQWGEISTIMGFLWSYTDKKENQIFLIYKEIQSGAVAKSFMRKGFLIYEEMPKYFPIYEEAVGHI
jgi:hypothetical protein